MEALEHKRFLDFGSATVAPTGAQLATDREQLLVTTASVAEAKRQRQLAVRLLSRSIGLDLFMSRAAG